MIDVQDLKAKLNELGFEVIEVIDQPRSAVRAIDFLLRVRFDDRELVLALEEKQRKHLTDLRLAAERLKQDAAEGHVPVIIADFLGPKRRALLRDLGVGYLDLAGNAYIRAPGVMVHRDERKNPFRNKETGLNPFSDKASLVLRLLFEYPDRSWGVREIARESGINPGWVSNVIKRLEERGFVSAGEAKGISLVRGEDLLHEWAEVYDWRRSRLHTYYCHAYDTDELLERVAHLKIGDSPAYALGFQAGAYLVAPYASFNEVHLLIDGRRFGALRSDIERQMQLEHVAKGGNLVLVEPYYKRSALFGARRIRDWWVASDIQLYLDLRRYPLRGEEQAEHIRESLIVPKLRLTDQK